MITILVPTDFSTTAKKAVEYAVFFAKKVNAHLVILHVYQIPVVSLKPLYVANPEAVKEINRLAEEQLNRLVQEVEGLKDIRFTTKALPMNLLIEFAEILNRQHADLIIMGTNGASGLKELIMGSNTASVIESANCPVLAIPANAPCTGIGTIGFAYDKEIINDFENLEFLKWFTRHFKALIEVFHVNNAEPESSASRHDDTLNRLKKFLQNLPFNYSEIFHSNVEEGINACLEEKKVDVLALMHRSRSLFDSLFRKSYSKKMAYQTTIPLLVIPE
ncbi:MAG: universal stress protein [Bacteroidia bacterium]|nr:universal stress protein [Bacteroidia bacterium]